MGSKDTDVKGQGLSRRDFMKVSAAATAVGGMAADWSFAAEKAMAYEGAGGYNVTATTCPYCSASCGQRVAVSTATSGVVDIYGDFESPLNSGGLCAKGAGSLQLVNNARRIGVGTAHAAQGLSAVFDYNGSYAASGVAYKRTAPSGWVAMDLQTALGDIATSLKTARDAAGAAPASGNGFNSKQVAFFGSSHMNNETNWVYRKIVANFGTSNTEHQARI